MKCTAVGLTCIAFVLLPLRLWADPVTVVSGELTTQVFSSFATFVLVGDNGSTFSGRWPGTGSGCSPCIQGIPSTFNSTFLYDTTPFVGGEPFASGTATVDNVTYPSLFFSGALHFTTTATAIPNFVVSSADTRVFSFTEPFTFSGTLSGFDRLLQGPQELSPLFTSSLNGSGTATIDLLGDRVNDRTVLTYLRTTYDFAPAATPEPQTWALLCVGLVALGLRRWSIASRHP